MIRTSAMGFCLCFLVSCSFGERLARTGVRATQQFEDDAGARQAERDAAVQQMLDRHEPEALSYEDIVRIGFQEWLDHRQRAWVPVAVASELVVNWPKVARATQITVTQQEVSIQATNSAGAQALKGALENAQWVKDVTASELLVSGHVVAVERVLAPDNKPDLLAEQMRFTSGKEGLQFSSSRSISDMNEPGQIAQEVDAFNCWHRVMQRSEGYKTLDGEWIEGGMRPVRPEKPTIQIGKWVEVPEKEEGKAWVRSRASKELRGSFPGLLQGLDCMKSTNVRFGVRKIDFKPDPSLRGAAILVYEIDLFQELPLDPSRETPWAKPDSWGEAERPERVRVLKDKTLANPFAK